MRASASMYRLKIIAGRRNDGQAIEHRGVIGQADRALPADNTSGYVEAFG
ncbi:uncharacterized protein CPUR_01786 [Claviceps purpurea 20.1]|uniref:Uncharacterized protein n=1 Tax=Claviceps purpurea (strain 20.1) TaxID=1111077 RepID=M1VZN2_CLAP2|nr:uncharacterized protein CPUR_01786 [Claviceps purpurea 20.1]